MEVRVKDKIFMAAFIPIAAAAAYFYYWRMDAARTLNALDAECAALVAPEDFPFEKRIREARIPEAQKELSDVRALPPPTPSVAADASAVMVPSFSRPPAKAMTCASTFPSSA